MIPRRTKNANGTWHLKGLNNSQHSIRLYLRFRSRSRFHRLTAQISKDSGLGMVPRSTLKKVVVAELQEARRCFFHCVMSDI
jgi:hypothetical protein